ncbi:MAG: cytoplasmic protein [Candidatus Hydrogenedentes bacterium]|nr:cytoplasmic protein [Candidatus Hydrogenedentota bacterium]
MSADTRTRFVSEQILPVGETFGASGMARGGPGLPARFTWRGQEYAVAEQIEQWHETGPCTHGSGEQYVRKHWFKIRTSGGSEMTLYFERQARTSRSRKARWWLYTVTEDWERT